jgi:FKBP-type peptidyl-prolyl cis-trans isomerase
MRNAPSVVIRLLLQVQKFSTTERGVKYFDIKEGNGYSPNPGQIVVLK